MKKFRFLNVLLMLIMSLGFFNSCGNPGPVGPQGEQGIQGEKGDTGEPGKDGVSIKSIEFDYSEGNKDYYKIIMSDGSISYFTVTNGEDGVNGINGQKGEDGHTPVITVNENGNWEVDGVDTGFPATGPRGPVGPKGDKGEKGDTGDTGPKGDKGDTGEPGKDGTSLLNGNGEPNDDLGKTGDSYIDLDSWDYYVKTGEGWVLKGNIKGEDGKDACPDHNGTEGLEFYPINDTECAVAVGRAKLLKEIVIPSKYKNYTVTTIYGLPNDGGFQNCSFLEKITLPDTITNIGEEAFYNCSSLESIDIPNSVTSIGNNVFSGCNSLVSMTVPFVGDALEETNNTHFGYIFGASSYSSNSSCVPESLKEVTITGGSIIASSAFNGCSSLESVKISYGITSIGWSSFYNCSSLTSISIPDSVTSILDNAFYECSNLTIYCKAPSQPDTWNDMWNVSDISVYWVGQWGYDGNGQPIPLN